MMNSLQQLHAWERVGREGDEKEKDEEEKEEGDPI